MKSFGRFSIECINFGYFRLDGGAMFGSVPKNIWSKRIAADEENCIRLATRCLLLKDEKRTILVDVGMGEKWSDKQRQIFAIQNLPNSLKPESVTDIVLTHLHFDHCGGISKYKNGASGEVELVYPQAIVHLQESNLKNAQNPNLRERASYLPENVLPIKSSKLNLVNGSTEIYPDLWVHQVNGHTIGQQWVEIKDGSKSMVYPTDLIPTSHHLPLPYSMGYDICAETILKEKDAFLTQALQRDSIVVFEHDADIAAARIKKDDKGHFAVKEVVEI